MRAFSLLRSLLAATLCLGLLSACDDDADKGTAGPAMGPDRVEGKVEDAKLRAFVPLFPAAPEGYTRSPDPGIYVSDSQSTIAFVYQKGAEMFSVTFVFSNQNTKQNLDMMADPATLKSWGFQVVEIAGRKALSALERGPGKADYLVVVSNSRNVAVAPAGSTLPDAAVVKQVTESIDFAAVATKD